MSNLKSFNDIDLQLKQLVNATIEKVTELPTASTEQKGRVVMNTADNIVYYCNGTEWIKVKDTGATDVEVTGSGNVVSSASYDATTRKITLNKGVTALTEHQSLEGYVNDVNNSGSGQVVTDVTKSGKVITVTKGDVPTLGRFTSEAISGQAGSVHKEDFAGLQTIIDAYAIDHTKHKVLLDLVIVDDRVLWHSDITIASSSDVRIVILGYKG